MMSEGEDHVREDPSAVIWVHGDCLRPSNPALHKADGAPALFVFDDEFIESYQITLKRIAFIYECLLELPVSIRRGNVPEQLLMFANEHQARRIVTTESPSPRFAEICDTLRPAMQLDLLVDPPFLAYDGPLDLRRFSNYWKTAQRYAYGQVALFTDDDVG